MNYQTPLKESENPKLISIMIGENEFKIPIDKIAQKSLYFESIKNSKINSEVKFIRKSKWFYQVGLLLNYFLFF